MESQTNYFLFTQNHSHSLLAKTKNEQQFCVYSQTKALTCHYKYRKKKCFVLLIITVKIP